MSSDLRIGGLASGIDTESIIKQLMQAQREPVTQLEQDKQILEWKQEDYREINTTLRSFRDVVFNMKLQKTFMTKEVTSSDDSVVTATANTTAIEGTHTIKVTQLAKSGYLTGGQLDASGDTTMSELGVTETELELTIAGKSLDAITVNSTTTINDLVNEINDLDGGIQASFDENLKRLFIMTTNTGSDQTITISQNDLTDALKLTQDNTYQAGQNAKYTLNGVDLESSTNKFTVHGINFNLKGIDTDNEKYIAISQDTDAVFDSIVNFVNEYNKVVELLSDKLYEVRYSDYEPLTDDENAELTDNQIEQWTEKARSGLLRNDSILSNVYSDMRMTMSKFINVDGDSNSLASIGITTTSDYTSAKLVIDEEKLREAIESDPEGILDLFTKSSDTGESDEIGIAVQLYKNVNSAMNSISQKAGSDSEYSLVDNSYIGKEITEIDDRIDKMNDRLDEIEERYWSQFTTMEEAIQEMNSQSSWLIQMFSTSS